MRRKGMVKKALRHLKEIKNPKKALRHAGLSALAGATLGAFAAMLLAVC